MAGEQRSYTGARFALDLAGEGGGFLRKVSGGTTQTEVVKEAAGPTNITFKNIGRIVYNEITMECGMSMSPGFYEWIGESWKKNYIRKHGAILQCDSYYRNRFITEFTDALITKTTFPALSGSEKSPCYMTVSIGPERIRYKPGDNEQVIRRYGTGQQKRWLPSNFRFELGGLDCKRVHKIDAFSIEQKFALDEVGGSRETTKLPAWTQYPDLKVTIAEVDLPTWYGWFEEFVIKGNNGADNELNGAITFLTPNLQDELGRIDLFGVGIFNLTQAGEKTAGGEEISRFTVDLYVESMNFVYGSQHVLRGNA